MPDLNRRIVIDTSPLLALCAACGDFMALGYLARRSRRCGFGEFGWLTRLRRRRFALLANEFSLGRLGCSFIAIQPTTVA